MAQRSWGKPDCRDLTVEELSNLLFTDAEKLQFDYCTPPIDCEMLAVAAKQVLASVSGNPLIGQFESCWTFHTLHAR